jgi:hypothetical protein
LVYILTIYIKNRIINIEKKNNRIIYICIEYDGEEHFRYVEIWGGEEEFENIKIRDQIKNEYCKNNNIRLIRIKYNDSIDNKLSFI